LVHAPGIRWDLVQQLGDMVCCRTQSLLFNTDPLSVRTHPRAFVALSQLSRVDICSRAGAYFRVLLRIVN
jgi:hypothetical protein